MPKSKTCSSLFLDSGGGWSGASGEKGSYMLFREPWGSIRFENGSVTVETLNGSFISTRDPLTVLEGYLSEGYAASGYIGYEYCSRADTGFIPEYEKSGKKFPDIYFLLFREEEIETGSVDDLRLALKISDYRVPPVSVGDKSSPTLSSNMDRDEYMRMVQRAKKYIESGDIYQVNLSQRYTAEHALSPLPCFLRMFHVQQVPFGSYMDFGEFQLLSGSMELFLRRRGGKIATKPIKGTRQRGVSGQADIIKKAELVASEKERAENLMIVDLMRNDLSRVCKRGSVSVRSLFDVESYATLHQMVSEVEGTLEEGLGVMDIIKNVFPPGSVTGAPKRRSLEIIDELEPHFRGPYCGALGVFYPGGDFTLSVGIRVMVTEPEKGTFWVGGGIVWDSDPLREYEETLLKSVAIRKAIGLIE